MLPRLVFHHLQIVAEEHPRFVTTVIVIRESHDWNSMRCMALQSIIRDRCIEISRRRSRAAALNTTFPWRHVPSFTRATNHFLERERVTSVSAGSAPSSRNCIPRTDVREVLMCEFTK